MQGAGLPLSLLLAELREGTTQWKRESGSVEVRPWASASASISTKWGYGKEYKALTSPAERMLSIVHTSDCLILTTS